MEGTVRLRMMLERRRAPRPRYTMVGETLRYVIPGALQCSVGCGGRSCKYEDPSRWSEEMQAVRGLYSSWVTDELLAMARPSTEIMQKYNIIEQFQRFGVKTVINLQYPGEHASCGYELEADSGFTYRPEAFMEADIYYYNYAWKDYGVTSLTTVLDIVKVMSFAVQEGKIAVHCHAGLGRTGVLLACYLVFTTQMSADQAITLVRAKRPKSIQTRGQLLCVRQFAQFLVPLRTVFSCAAPKVGPAVTLSQYLVRQSHLLHGVEARLLRHTPKIVQAVCQLLLDVARNRQVVQEDVLEVLDPSAERKAGASPSAPRKGYREARGRGGALRPRPLPGPATVPVRRVESSLFYANRSLSYSDSDCSRSGVVLTAPEDAGKAQEARVWKRQCLSQEDLRDSGETMRRAGSCTLEICSRLSSDSLNSSTGSVWDHRPTSCGTHCPGADSAPHSRNERCAGAQEEERSSEVPFILLQSELSADARRLLVAQALALDLEQDGEEKHKQSVSRWQMELNSEVGVWDSLCTEQDPFVLSGLMWSWLEQLKEPVLSTRDVCALEGQHQDPSSALKALSKGPRLTLSCILDCAAQVMSSSVESAFLNRTIKGFTQIKAGESEEGEMVYKTMRPILASVLRERKSLKEVENSGTMIL